MEERHGGKTWRIKNRVVSLQLLSYNHEETDCRIAPRTKLQSNGGVVIVEKDVDISMFLIYSYSICASVMRGKMRQWDIMRQLSCYEF